ncbi:C40 family peptidase [Clostridium sp. E02]|uniref:C40 family peptidase n=1 Tax=Clostridium sp. E02 TaxID=2487134 RepID=UPI000F541229|nr:C40 family peptidase [Clostridium sp. E02]
MKLKMMKAMGLLGLLTSLCLVVPTDAEAGEITVETSTTLYAQADKPESVRSVAGSDGMIVEKTTQGQTYEVVETEKDGWLKVKTSAGEGYIPSDTVTLIEKTQETVDKDALIRNKVADYASRFIGGRYIYGGVNPNTGVDCSGFTRYVLQHAAGVELSHSSRVQAKEGTLVNYETARPGDLVFYGRKGRISHVALYVGDGKVVHASTEKTGIIETNVMYRNPVKFVSVLN